MMTSLFQQQPERSSSPVPSMQDEPVGGSMGASPGLASALPRGSPAGAQAVFRDGGTSGRLKGRGKLIYDRRKYNYDVVRGKAAALAFETSKDDRMSAGEAGRMLERIHAVFGIDREVESVLHAFDRALFFSHTVNGGSVLTPGRCTFSVPGVTETFSFSQVRDVLGVDQRRFFRAFADDIAEVNKDVLRAYDPADVVRAEQWGWLQQVAHDRGLSRYPHLAHDSADACLGLSPGERAAVAASKASVISTTNNSADRLRANSRVQSADNYDSTVGERL